MGKSNRIRANRASEAVRKLDTKPQKKEMPLWVMSALAILLAVAVVAGLAVSLLSANGVFTRMTTVMETENYKVNATMMSYYFNTQYQTFYSNYSAYLSSSSLDVSKSLKTQKVDPSNQFDMMLLQYSFGLSTYEGTWYQLFMDQSIADVSEILIYCEEADNRGIKLTDEEENEIDEALKTMSETAASQGYTMSSYLAAYYGEGVSKSDVKRALRYSSLASKCATEIGKELESKIDDVRVNEKYASDPDAFDVVDFYSYTLSTSYSEIQNSMFTVDATTTLTAEQKAAILEAYNKKVEELKALAEELKTVTDTKVFAEKVVNFVANDSYDDTYKAALKAANEAAKKADANAADITELGEEDMKAIKAALIAEVIEAVLADKTEIEDAVKIDKDYKETTIEVYGKTASVELAEVLNTTKQDLFEMVQYDYDNLNSEKVGKSSIFKPAGEKATDEEKKSNSYKIAEWLFNKDTAKMDKNTFEDAPDADTKDADKKYSISVLMLTETKRKDTTPTRDVAYIAFDDSKLAANAIADILKETKMDLATFEKYATKWNVEMVSIENYQKGTLGYTSFDDWAYADDRKAGDVTKTAINISSYYYFVAYYDGEGNETWYETVKDAVFSEDTQKYQENLVATYKVTIHDKALDKIGA